MKVTYVKLVHNQPFYVGMGSEFRALNNTVHHKTKDLEEHVCSLIVSKHHDKVGAELQEQGMILWLRPAQNAQSHNSGENVKNPSRTPWWTNGVDEEKTHHPPKGWVRGRKPFQPVSQETRDKQSKQRSGRRWWTDGRKNVYTYKCPPGFQPGKTLSKDAKSSYAERTKRNAGKHWFNNGKENRICVNPPDGTWKRGRI